MMNYGKWMVLAAFASGFGCASIEPRVTYSSFGEASLDHDEEVMESFREVPTDETVKVLIDTLPVGVSLNDGTLTVAEGYGHRLVGKFTVAARGEQGGFMALFGFADYEKSGLSAYCAPQTVLNYATLFLWGMVVPLSYPCWGSTVLEKKGVLDEVKQLATAAGGDLVIMGFLANPLGGSTREVWGASGFVLELDPRMKGQPLETQPQKLSGAEDRTAI